MKIAVTGASGLVGRALIRKLLLEGHEVRALARNPSKILELPQSQVYVWRDSEKAPAAAFDGVDAIVHLAGEGVADARWTKARKERLVDSRVKGTHNLLAGVRELAAERRPQALIAASAIGYYGDTGETQADETSPPGADFLARLCVSWEEASSAAGELGLRVAIARIGIVLSREGGALAKMGPATLGSGRQWMSWVHIDDLVRFFVAALKDTSFTGSYNLTAPQPVRNRDFTKVLAKTLGYPFVLPAPGLALKLVLGELASALLASQRVAPVKTLASGFRFEHEDLAEALGSIYRGATFLDDYFSASLFVPLERAEVFPFFSRAENLEVLTPPWLQFKILDKSSETIARDTLIDYKLKIKGVPVRWKTKIVDWRPGESFVDDQLSGPYKKWTHLHAFDEVPGGTLLRDEVTFR
ncbi:MAG TPA: TIGR01777 family oxidoreductase, partial [Bdellovibrionales bacterium]|nr:TIGR01777 family oxidoreductase [Bdellovibrionales bacterium]